MCKIELAAFSTFTIETEQHRVDPFALEEGVDTVGVPLADAGFVLVDEQLKDHTVIVRGGTFRPVVSYFPASGADLRERIERRVGVVGLLVCVVRWRAVLFSGVEVPTAVVAPWQLGPRWRKPWYCGSFHGACQLC